MKSDSMQCTISQELVGDELNEQFEEIRGMYKYDEMEDDQFYELNIKCPKHPTIAQWVRDWILFTQQLGWDKVFGFKMQYEFGMFYTVRIKRIPKTDYGMVPYGPSGEFVTLTVKDALAVNPSILVDAE